MANKRRPNGYVPHESGIYRILNKINGKCYVGQSENIAKRWFHHRWELQRKKHINVYLQNAWDKYGEENFEFQVLELCPIEQLDEREIYWISFYDSKYDGYNFLAGGCGTRDRTYSEEGRNRPRKNGRVRRVVQFDQNFNFIKLWDSSHQAAKALGVESKGIRNCCQKVGHQKSIKGYFWAYEEDWNSGNIDREYYKMKFSQWDKPVCQFTVEGVYIKTWSTMKEAAKAYGFDANYIVYACEKSAKRKRTSHGFVWRYLEDVLLRKSTFFDVFIPLQIIKKEDVNQCQMS